MQLHNPGLLRGLRYLEMTAAAPSVLGSGLLPLAFLPSLHTLVLSLDLPPACPEQLRDLPTALKSLSLSNMWLTELPKQLTDLTGENECNAVMLAVGCTHLMCFAVWTMAATHAYIANMCSCACRHSEVRVQWLL